jgi:hypothetical protein
MLRACALALASSIVLASLSPAAGAQERAYELRTYTAEDGRLEALHKRFRDHTVKLFEKHGMTVVGFWVPSSGETSANTLVYLLSFPSEQARNESWKAFADDPEWKKVSEESQRDGRMLKKVESVMLKPTDYSPLR